MAYTTGDHETQTEGLTPEQADSYVACLLACAATPALVAEFDRLTGSNLSMRGTPLELEIDRVTGRVEADLERFAEFVRETVWATLGCESGDDAVLP